MRVALFLGLYLGHVLGDFVFQPGRLVIAKRKDPRAAVAHTFIVTVCTALALTGSLSRIWPAVLLAGGAHLVVERITIRARRRPGARGLTVFLFDQGLHMVMLALIALAPWSSVEPVIGIWRVSMSTLAAVCGVSTVAFAGSILIFEIRLIRMRRWRSGAEPDPILALDFPRAYGIAERGTALAAGLALQMPALGALVFLPRIAYAMFSPAERRLENLVSAGTGITLCAIAWVLLALIGQLH